MKKYCKIVDDETKQVNIGLGDDVAFYKSIGFELADVAQGNDGQWYLSDFVPKMTTEEAKATKWAEIVQGQSAILEEFKNSYPDDEREGWPFKFTEAKAVMAGEEDTATPYLDAEVSGSGGLYKDRIELAKKVINGNNEFKALHGFINGQQTAMYHALNELAATPGVTADEILSMPVEYIVRTTF